MRTTSKKDFSARENTFFIERSQKKSEISLTDAKYALLFCNVVNL